VLNRRPRQKAVEDDTEVRSVFLEVLAGQAGVAGLPNVGADAEFPIAVEPEPCEKVAEIGDLGVVLGSFRCARMESWGLIASGRSSRSSPLYSSTGRPFTNA